MDPLYSIYAWSIRFFFFFFYNVVLNKPEGIHKGIRALNFALGIPLLVHGLPGQRPRTVLPAGKCFSAPEWANDELAMCEEDKGFFFLGNLLGLTFYIVEMKNSRGPSHKAPPNRRDEKSDCLSVASRFIVFPLNKLEVCIFSLPAACSKMLYLIKRRMWGSRGSNFVNWASMNKSTHTHSRRGGGCG